MEISAKEFGSKYKNKQECERFLRNELDAYLPGHKYVTVWHYRDLIAGEKKVSSITIGGHDLLKVYNASIWFHDGVIEPFLRSAFRYAWRNGFSYVFQGGGGIDGIRGPAAGDFQPFSHRTPEGNG